MEYLREQIEQIVFECDIAFLQWLCESLPEGEQEIRDVISIFIDAKLASN